MALARMESIKNSVVMYESSGSSYCSCLYEFSCEEEFEYGFIPYIKWWKSRLLSGTYSNQYRWRPGNYDTAV